VNARVTASIEAILLKALAKDRDQRYQSGGEFAAALKTAIAQAAGEYVTLLYQQAVTLQQQGNWEAAEAKLREVLAIQPDYAPAQALLQEVGRQYESQRRYQQLAEQVKQLQLEAVALRQLNPALEDEARVFSLLAPSEKPARTPGRALSRNGKLIIAIACLVLLGAAGALAWSGMQASQAAITATSI
jgi:tetratricopeptide (TPR) repeat protein